MKLKLGGGYAHALRAIGQDLQRISPESFEVIVSGKDFIAHGYRRLSRVTPKTNNNEQGFIGKFWQKLSRSSRKATNPSHAVLTKFERVYSPNDIKQLDGWEASRRIDAAKLDQAQIPDLHSLQEQLRMIGRIIDDKPCALIKLSRNTNALRADYKDGEGKIDRCEYSVLSLLNLQQQYYVQRQIAMGDPWQKVRARG